jgi:hypothetical protein
MMEESTTYQLLLARGEAAGRLEEARHLLLQLGRVKFGRPADNATAERIEQITDLDRLRALAGRVLDVSGWQELLAEP